MKYNSIHFARVAFEGYDYKSKTINKQLKNKNDAIRCWTNN